MARSLVSVVIPFYDTSPAFFTEAIESVRAQTYAHWELILIDDGAPAPAAELAQAYAARYPGSIRTAQHAAGQNRGISASRNLGLELARGDYVGFLDADDVWLPGKLAEQTHLLDEHPAVGMNYGRTLYWYSWTGKPEDAARDHTPDLGVPPPGTVVRPPTLLPLLLTGRATVPCTCGILVRRDLARAVGGFEAAFPGLYEDQVFYAKMCLAAPVLGSAGVWDRYRQHAKSVTSRATQSDERTSRLQFLDWLQGYLLEREIRDRAVWTALRSERWKLGHPWIAGVLRRARRLGRRLSGT